MGHLDVTMPLEDSHGGWVTWMCQCHWRIYMKDGGHLDVSMPLEDSHEGWATWMCQCHWRIHMEDGSPRCVNVIRGFTWRMGHLDASMPLEL
eukprot:1055635-Pyramimonas_sp.AAC.1